MLHNHRRQATARWELDRAVRRAILRERLLVFVGGVLVALAFFGGLTALFTVFA